jgi:hypothetical protein
MCAKTTSMDRRDEFAKIAYLAFKIGTNPFSISGQSNELIMGLSSTVTTCSAIQYSFDITPVVVTAINYSLFPNATVHPPASVWAEEVSVNGFRVCTRLLLGYGASASQIEVNWLAIVPDRESFPIEYMPICNATMPKFFYCKQCDDCAAKVPASPLEADRMMMVQISDLVASEGEQLVLLGSKIS